MASPNFPLGVQPNPLVKSPYGYGFQNEFPSDGMSILTEAGDPLQTEAGQNLLIE